MKKILTLLFALFVLNLSCSEEKKPEPTRSTYIGHFSADYLAQLGFSAIENENEQIEAAKSALERIFRENDIKIWQNIEMQKASDTFFWFTVDLIDQEISKLTHEKRVIIEPDSEFSIFFNTIFFGHENTPYHRDERRHG
ncbi:hypothetical protein PQ465_05980 [Sphingobacterium oryzagri]|uniref:Lipoprotein n=1 Tax=Sphingobacterium oryzagri TaxID=3025669 RepID=A0ABY7WL91_9SPHI|nr:hypothetical protein [Sphingobacterium sp. KACC 22765]WDF69923.1 hypothetical protein PQ465_05980 [Sphingobacterium sp. KACC 22765]